MTEIMDPIDVYGDLEIDNSNGNIIIDQGWNKTVSVIDAEIILERKEGDIVVGRSITSLEERLTRIERLFMGIPTWINVEYALGKILKREVDSSIRKIQQWWRRILWQPPNGIFYLKAKVDWDERAGEI